MPGGYGAGSPYGRRYWPFSVFPIVAGEPGFQGLNLESAPDEVGNSGCIDLLNVDFDKRGSIRTRDGTVTFTSPAASTGVQRMFPFYHSADQLLTHYTTGSGANVTAYTTAGAAVATYTVSGSGAIVDFASAGSPGAQRAYVCDSGAVMQRWDGSAYTAVTGSPQCSFVTNSGIDNRLVAANIAVVPTGSGATASSSLVHFSDAGAPETWSANNYIYLTPGDGDAIRGVVSWRDQLIVFKRFRFFVFTNTSTDSTGNPVFNYRTVDTHTGLQSNFAAVAAPEGVYFAAGDGIYVTTGQNPIRISDPIGPWFTGQLSPYWLGSGFSGSTWGDGTNPQNVWGDGTDATNVWGGGPVTNVRLAYSNGRLFAFPYGQTACFVYTAALKSWSYWEFAQPNYSMTGFQVGGAGPEFLHLGQTTTVQRQTTTATTDNGSTIQGRFRSGIYAPYGYPSVETVIRETFIEGQGTVTVALAKDYATALPTTGGGAATSVALGTSPVSDVGRYRVAQKANRYSIQVSGVAPWRIDSITNHLTMPQPPGLHE